MSPSDPGPTLVERAHQTWSGARDGRRSARRLSHLGAHAWLARREQEQSALDAAAADCVDRWVRAIAGPREVLVAAGRGDGMTTADPEVPIPAARPEGMAQVRQARRRRAQLAARLAQEHERAERSAAARSHLESLIESTAAELHLLQARHTLLFAMYTRAFIRAYSRATTVHAPEPEWMLHLVRPEAVALTQSVLAVDGARHAA